MAPSAAQRRYCGAARSALRGPLCSRGFCPGGRFQAWEVTRTASAAVEDFPSPKESAHSPKRQLLIRKSFPQKMYKPPRDSESQPQTSPYGLKKNNNNKKNPTKADVPRGSSHHTNPVRAESQRKSRGGGTGTKSHLKGKDRIS